MRRFSCLVLGLVVFFATVSPGAATVATIATTAPLEDHQEQSVALRAALKAAVAGAQAMGLAWIQISRALVLDDAVAVQILATDEDPGPNTEDEAPAPDRGSDADAGAPAEHTL